VRSRLSSLLNQNPALPLVALALAVLLAGLLVLRRGDGSTLPAEGGTLVEQAVGPVERVNPLLGATPAERDLATLVFAGPDPTGQWRSDRLAEEWAFRGRSTFTFDLRRGLSRRRRCGGRCGIHAPADPGRRRRRSTAAGGLAQRHRHRKDGCTPRATPAPFAALPAYAGFGLLRSTSSRWNHPRWAMSLQSPSVGADRSDCSL
jgi:hypothetical protein